jgi:hypothetical protein
MRVLAAGFVAKRVVAPDVPRQSVKQSWAHVLVLMGVTPRGGIATESLFESRSIEIVERSTR